MREQTARSVKLNREIARMLPEAMDKDRLVKIGYGSGGDTKPRDGDFGVVTHLPTGSRVLLLGNLGECVGAMNRGGTLNIEGSCESMLAAFQSDGRVVVERDVGDRLAMNMTGGSVTVMGSAGKDACAGMHDGIVIVRGQASSGAGSGMFGGTLVVMGSVGLDPGLGMKGGRVIIAGSCPPPGKGSTMRSITSKEVMELETILEPLGLSLEEDALVLVPDKEVLIEDKTPERWVSEGFEGIGISPSSSDRIPKYSVVDTSVNILPVGSDEGGLELPIPWMIRAESGLSFGERQLRTPSIVNRNPNQGDLLMVGEEELIQFPDNVRGSSGIVLDLQSLPPLNDAELESILVSLSSHLESSALILLKDGVDRVEGLFRLVVDLDLDGAIVSVASPGGGKAAAALPRIGLASRAMGLDSQRRIVGIELDKQPSAEDLIIGRASGCSFIVGPIDEENDILDVGTTIVPEIIGIMKEVGLSNFHNVGRRILRAKNMETAAISGLRLVGFERPLPMWLGN